MKREHKQNMKTLKAEHYNENIGEILYVDASEFQLRFIHASILIFTLNTDGWGVYI